MQILRTTLLHSNQLQVKSINYMAALVLYARADEIFEATSSAFCQDTEEDIMIDRVDAIVKTVRRSNTVHARSNVFYRRQWPAISQAVENPTPAVTFHQTALLFKVITCLSSIAGG